MENKDEKENSSKEHELTFLQKQQQDFLKKKNDELLSTFLKICHKKNIWYSLSGISLLKIDDNTVEIENYDIVMTPESFRELKTHSFENVLDGTTNNDFQYCHPKFVTDNKFFKNINVFLNIDILIATTPERIKKFGSLKNKIAIWVSKKRVTKTKKKFSHYMFSFFLKFFFFWVQDMDLRKAVSILESQKHRGFFLLNYRASKINDNWINQITFQTKDVNFLGFNAKIFVENKKFLKSIFPEK